MEKQSTSSAALPAAPKAQEKILFEIQPFMLPTILNIENLTMIGFTVVILIAAVVFHFGISEFIIIAALYLLIAIPAFQSIFRAGSTSYVLTNQRLVIFSVGFGQKERSIPLDQIQDAKSKSSGLQRVYGSGDVIIYLKSLRKPVRMLGIRASKQRAAQILEAAKKFRG